MGELAVGELAVVMCRGTSGPLQSDVGESEVPTFFSPDEFEDYSVAVAHFPGFRCRGRGSAKGIAPPYA